MSGPGLDEAFDRFSADLLFDADASGEPQAAAFFGLYGQLAAESGDCIDLTYTPAHLRDVEKALGLPDGTNKLLSSQAWGWSKGGADKTGAPCPALHDVDLRQPATSELVHHIA